MSKINDPQSVSEILGMNLAIPDYQRPYKWKSSNVMALIGDICDEMQQKHEDPSYRYRIGSIILHEPQGEQLRNIVDGQQRLLTICLIMKAIRPDSAKTAGLSLLECRFSNRISLDNLKYNYNAILRYFSDWSAGELTRFADFLLEKCEMIIISTTDIAEAFQLFDSQNARGKNLEPADLLKAYHLRVMTDEHEKRMCSARWEEAIDRKVLHSILAEIIYRCRCWSRRDYYCYDFSKDTIDEFKGIDVKAFMNGKGSLPYMERLYFTSRLDTFAIDEPIVNGKRFFDYVDHYVALCERLFPAVGDRRLCPGGQKIEDDNPLQHLVRRNCYYSPKMYRAGDRRLRNVLYCLLLCFYDRFGEHNYTEFFNIVYRYVYRVRLDLTQVRLESIRQYILEGLTTGEENRKGVSAASKRPFEWIARSPYGNVMELRGALPLPAEEITPEKLNQSFRS